MNPLDIARECGAKDTVIDQCRYVAFDGPTLAAYTARIRAQAIKDCEKAVLDEKVDADATHETGDYAYNLALDHAAAAIRSLKAEK